MQKIVTQVVVGTPPENITPVVEIQSDGQTYLFDEHSLTDQKKLAVVNDGRYWLVFTGHIKMGTLLEIVIHGSDNKKHTIQLNNLSVGITRFFRKDFGATGAALPKKIFLDVVVQDAPVEVKNLVPPSPPLRNNRPGRNLPPPPGTKVRPAVQKIEKRDPTIQTLFPKVHWTASPGAKGSIYDQTTRFVAEYEWVELEKELIKKFCVARIQKKPSTPFKPASETIPAVSGTIKTRILSERQEFLLSVVLGALEKRKVSLVALGTEIKQWLADKQEIEEPEAITNIAGVFPPEAECNKILAANTKDLSPIESQLYLLLSDGSTRGMFLLAKYYLWSIPALHALKKSALNMLASLDKIEGDTQLPKLLVLSLKLGNSINLKYAATSSNTIETRALMLSSLSAFQRCTASLTTPDACSYSLLEFLVLSLRHKIDFKALYKSYLPLSTFQIKTLNEHLLMIKQCINEVFDSNDFPGKQEKMLKLETQIKENELLLESITDKFKAAAKKYADTPDSFISNLADALDTLGRVSHLFL
ncbi:hypothetical protein NEHOM01_0223 [Nematocida homosporus]|uniref:uncharacterized protein n=1 Tax=Nematocida homosporus TaxID=1912981 RepID=UPI0022207DEB|nr:uncharacterized protein NEHOM01_0223 [Nematocida homosporus]KAI5184548.1 hypothetical protein NEHOM01_0223 [Nematocida homosporus]